ncbi:MAG TPA: phosphatase PAP2 family protein [Thermoanaerobaculia bacterium]|nr:phosphatase PAP2 family protein [Thermoanaerobaculia bacterium]
MIALLCFGAVFLALWGTTFALFPSLVRSIRSGVSRLARWLRGRSRLGPLFGRLETWRSYLPLVIALAIGTLVIVWTADAFTDIAVALKEKSPTVQRIDAGAYEWFGSRRTPFASALFVTITTMGGPVGMGALVATVLAVLVTRRRFRWASYLAITSLGGALLNQLLKFHFVRQRPDLKEAVLGAMGYSFPSGHAMSGAIILGALAYLAARSIREWKHKSAALAALATLALAIGISRVYLGVHWVSDVAAGFAAGLLWVTATTTGYELFRQYRLGQAGRARRRATAASGAGSGLSA